MCRLIIIAGEHSSLPRIRGYVEAFADSAENDPYLEAITHGKSHSHDDGWGYIVIGPSKRVVYKSLQPVYNDQKGQRYLEEALNDEWFIAILHARKAATGQPKSLENVHPMCVHSPTYGLVCVSHNGTVYKDKIAKTLGLEGMENRLNDTFFLAKFVAGNSDIKESLRRLIELKLVKTAINTGIGIPEQRMAGITVYNIYGNLGGEREKYYRFYRVEGEGFTAYSSSTLIDYYMSEESRSKLTIIPVGSYIEIKRLSRGFAEKRETLVKPVAMSSKDKESGRDL